MTLWLDAQLPPALAYWITYRFGIKTVCVRDLGLREASDMEIFERARKENAVVMTKDSDFVELFLHFGAPPKIIIVHCGNMTNKNLQAFLEPNFEAVLQYLQTEAIVELF
ncbi:MAG: DUF5615 family PIN-like protein [Campylobacterales bacterium]|nr:DUF5615 family PIN-like protein [Campylobacterales bacterium]